MLGVDLHKITGHVTEAVSREIQPFMDRLDRVIELLENIEHLLDSGANVRVIK